MPRNPNAHGCGTGPVIELTFVLVVYAIIHIEEPVIAPVKTKNVDILETEMPTVVYTREFACGLQESLTLVRNVALVGHLHSGKTCFMDHLVKQTHPRISSNGVKGWDLQGEVCYTDVRRGEQERGISIKAMPMSLVRRLRCT